MISLKGRIEKNAGTAKDSQHDKASFTWFVKETPAGTPISGPVCSIPVQKTPNGLHVDNPSDFYALKGWLHEK